MCVCVCVEKSLTAVIVLSDYYQSAVGIPRPSGGVTGAPSQGGLGGTANQQVMGGGPPPAQLGQPGGPVSLGIVQGPGGVVGVGGLGGESTAGPAASSGKQGRRKFALDIVDPKTMKNIDVYEENAASSSTPPRSGDSSARDTPQPVSALLSKLTCCANVWLIASLLSAARCDVRAVGMCRRRTAGRKIYAAKFHNSAYMKVTLSLGGGGVSCHVYDNKSLSLVWEKSVL
jgi:hypothetical protein